MTDATDLWAAVLVSYDNKSLRELTGVHDPTITGVNDTVGEDAAQGVINYWPVYAQIDYDGSLGLHVEVAKRGVIALLYERGGSSPQVAKLKWDDVFTNGIIDKLKNTGPRGRQGPKTNSNLTQPTGLSASGRRKIPWSSPEALPIGMLPRDSLAGD